MKQPILARGGPRSRGVIDTISAGYGIVNRQPWLLIAPILLDALLWLGPQMSLAVLAGEVLNAPLPVQEMDETSRRGLEDLRAMAEGSNVLVLLQSPLRMGIPSALAVMGGGGLAGQFMLPNWGVAGLLMLGSLAVGLLLGGFYRAALAQQVLHQATGFSSLTREALAGAWRIGRLLLLALVVLVLAALLAAVLIALLSLVSPLLGGVVLVLVVGLALLADIYIFFAPDAIYVRRVGARQSIRDSVTLVRANPWAALRFIVLVSVILAGMSQVWLLLAERGPAGMLLAVLGNAYIASGLAAASMVYYQERAASLDTPSAPA